MEILKNKSTWVKRETLKLHKLAPGTRIASSLSCIEILTVLYYGGLLNYNPKELQWEERDRFIISKAHGAVSFYPVLADLGFFDKRELEKIGKDNSMLPDIPDNSIPGFETINGSLGHGLGVACGMALALKRKRLTAKVVVLSGDGELYEGSVWEAIMFAAHNNLDNLILIIDNNKICMMDYCRSILNIEPLDEKFGVFNWVVKRVDGHDIEQLCNSLEEMKADESDRPKVLIADTIKGKGVPSLERDPLCHIKALKEDEIDRIIMGLRC